MKEQQNIIPPNDIGEKHFFYLLTSKDGLVNTQGGGLDGSNPDVSGDFVTNCGIKENQH